MLKKKKKLMLKIQKDQEEKPKEMSEQNQKIIIKKRNLKYMINFMTTI